MISLLAVLATSALTLSAQRQDPDFDPTLSDMAARYCIEPDGDHRLTWTLAERDGFEVMPSADHERLRMPGLGGVRGFSKTERGVEYRILTAAYGQTGPTGRAYFRRCWLSASVYAIDDANRELRDLLGFRPFRVKESSLYAWIPLTDGSRRPVSRRTYMRRALRLADEQGLREVSAKQYGPQVFISYASPRDRATFREFDWAGPEPVAAPD
jgi:hypothetical protein